jgi:stage II sporulation protein D
MKVKLIFFHLLLLIVCVSAGGQVRVRIFANKSTSSAVFTVASGEYQLDIYGENPMTLTAGEPVILERYDGRIAVKTRNSMSFICDSLILRGSAGNDKFSLRINGKTPVRQMYSGDLQCIPDLGKLVFINTCNIEQYIAGVIKAEGGDGKYIEYLKTQALLARTYMYKYYDRHVLDRYNLCDNTHCQAFNGITTDTMILRAAFDTKGLVVKYKDGTLINAAFHSNCGGETCSSEDVWLSGYPYLKKVTDPYCAGSRNARWTKTMKLDEWKAYLRAAGYASKSSDPSVFNFSQITRVADYRVGSFSLPFRQIRDDLKLKSAFFSVMINGDTVILKGRGYGHGVGLCQEGAMVMASRGFKFSDIINFYFSDVNITNVKNELTAKDAKSTTPNLLKGAIPVRIKTSPSGGGGQ